MGTLVNLICIAVASFAVLAQPAVAQGANTTLPLTYGGQVLQGDGSQTCPSEAQRERTRNEVKNATGRLLRESVVPLLQGNQTSQISQTICDGTTGWRRVAYLNMSDPSQQCPSVWREYTSPQRVCGRRSTLTGSCEGVTYTTGSTQYDQVCGRIIGYQIGSPEAFLSGYSINTYYVDGISVTRGSPRQHIWTFATGWNEVIDRNPETRCPCITGSTNGNNIASFVGQNYFCESGITSGFTNGLFYANGDPLWDGQGCGPTSSCCTFNSPPWFNVRLPSSTTDNIEVRICSDQGTNVDGSPIQLLELYVK